MTRPEADQVHEAAEALVRTLIARGQTVATAESLTGGLIVGALTSIPGASAVVLGGVVAYATRLKHDLLGVPEKVLRLDGVISGATVAAMAAGVRRVTGADWGIAVSGVAGPDPQEGHLPGEVWVCVQGPTAPPWTNVHHFVGDRTDIREQTILTALRASLAQLGA